MSDSYAAYKEDLADYNTLCTLLQVTPLTTNIYDHLDALKADPRVVYRDHHYQLITGDLDVHTQNPTHSS